MHDHDGMSMNGYSFWGMHVFLWIFFFVIVIVLGVLVSRFRKGDKSAVKISKNNYGTSASC